MQSVNSEDRREMENLEKGIDMVNIDGIKKNINKYIEEKGI